jgi:hypothetical protein
MGESGEECCPLLGLDTTHVPVTFGRLLIVTVNIYSTVVCSGWIHELLLMAI